MEEIRECTGILNHYMSDFDTIKYKNLSPYFLDNQNVSNKIKFKKMFNILKY